MHLNFLKYAIYWQHFLPNICLLPFISLHETCIYVCYFFNILAFFMINFSILFTVIWFRSVFLYFINFWKFWRKLVIKSNILHLVRATIILYDKDITFVSKFLTKLYYENIYFSPLNCQCIKFLHFLNQYLCLYISIPLHHRYLHWL